MRRIDEVLEKFETKIQPPKLSAAIVWWRNDNTTKSQENADEKTAATLTSIEPAKDSAKEPVKKEQTVPLTVEPKTHSENGSKHGESPTAPALVPVKI